MRVFKKFERGCELWQIRLNVQSVVLLQGALIIV